MQECSAQYGKLRGATYSVVVEKLVQLVDGRDRAICERDDDVAPLEAGARSRAPRLHRPSERLRTRQRDLARALAAIRREPVSALKRPCSTMLPAIPSPVIRWTRRTTEKIATELVLRARRQFVPLRDTRRADLRTLRSALRDQSRSSTYRPSSARSILRRIAASSLCFTRCVCHPRTAPRPRRQLKPLPTAAPEARRLLLPDANAKARPDTIADPFTVNLNLDTDLPAIPRIPVDLLGVAIRLVEHPLIASSCRHRPAPAIRTRIEKHDSVVLSKMSLRKLELHVVYTRIVAGALPGAKIAHLYRSKRRYLNASKLGPIRVAPAVPRRPQVVRNRTPRRNRETRVGRSQPLRPRASAKWSAVLYDPPHALVGRLSRSGPPGSCAFRWRYP